MRVLLADWSGELELSGTALELLQLAGLLRSPGGTVPLDMSGDPSPYSRALEAVVAEPTSGKAGFHLSPDQKRLHVDGGRLELDALALGVQNFAELSDVSEHMHVEPIPDHEFLSPDGAALVIAFER